MRKLRKAIGKKDEGAAKRLRQNKPKYKLDKIVKERFVVRPLSVLTPANTGSLFLES